MRYHPDDRINEEVMLDAAEAARADLTAGLPCTACPVCGRTHNRGFVDGHDTYRCMHCGVSVSPRNFASVVAAANTRSWYDRDPGSTPGGGSHETL